MVGRTTLQNRSDARYYVNRGVTVCERWRDFRNFLTDMGERPANTSLDRINNNRGYEPGNCRWATPAEQNQNNRQAKLLFPGAVQIVLRKQAGESTKDIANSLGIHRRTVQSIVAGKTWKGAVEEAQHRLAA